MDPRHLKYAQSSAPRYTSYPTAAQFTTDVNGDTHGQWLRALRRDASLSLYLHVPYCHDMCWYCGCNTQAVRRAASVDTYVDLLVEEITRAGAASPARHVEEMHWGGGTPNLLSESQFARLCTLLAATFDLSPDMRHAIELDPRSLTASQIAVYAAHGVNRASLGAQDFNPHVQRAIGRIQPFDVVAAAVERLRAAGIQDISLDLMYGLPQQRVADVIASVRLATSLRPQRVSLFGYAHVPWMKKRQRLIDESTLPDALERFEQAETARAELLQLGYVAIGLDHFALPDDALTDAARSGDLHRSFQGYVVGQPTAILGFGPSAISTFPQGYTQNAHEVRGWSDRVRRGETPVVRGRALTADDRVRQALIERIMCAFEVNLDDFGGAHLFAEEREALSQLQSDGLARLDGARVFIPVEARPFCRIVAQVFDAYAPTRVSRHSTAV